MFLRRAKTQFVCKCWIDRRREHCVSPRVTERTSIRASRALVENNIPWLRFANLLKVLTRREEFRFDFFFQMNSEENDARITNQLDGKRGWVVTAACFMAAFLTDGITFCFGLILFELVQVFDEPVEKVAWIPSFLLGIQLLSGKL